MIYTHNLPWIRAVWLTILLLCLALFAASLPGYFNDFSQSNFYGSATIADSGIQKTAVWVGSLLSIFASLLSISLGIIVYVRKPEYSIAVFFSIYLILYGIMMTGPIERANAVWLPENPTLALVLQAIFFPLPNILLLLVFPNGRFEPRWSRWLVLVVLLLSTAPVFIDSNNLLRPSTYLAQTFYIFTYGTLLLAIAIQLYRYRTVYTYTEKQQTKWAVFGILLWFTAMGISSIPFYYVLFLPSGAELPWWLPFSNASWWLTVSILPVAFTIAILRSRLWDIDLIVRRTLLYSMVTAALALVYYGLVTLLQNLFSTATGQQSTIAVVISTLAIAALFNPLRARLQVFIDRRFYRQKYNAENALAEFSSTARSETDINTLTSQLVNTLHTTVQPENVRIWLLEKSE